MWMFVFLCGARPRLGVTFASFGLVRFAFLIVLKRWRLWVLVLFHYFFMESLILAQDERWRRA